MENKGEIIIYETSDHEAQVEVKFEQETVWLNQYQLAELFQHRNNNFYICNHILSSSMGL